MTMEIDTALTIINDQIIYVPGWEFQAEAFTNRFESAVKVEVEYPAFATERKEVQANGAYTRPITTGGKFPLYLVCDSEITLLRQMLEQIILPIHCHEARESLRLKPTFWAPFHPHKTGGMERWGTPHDDLMFGLA